MIRVDSRIEEVSVVRRHHPRIAAFVCLCLVMGLSPGLVLCVCCDGDAAIRPGFHAHDEHAVFASAPDGAEEPLHKHEEGHNHCGRCADVPLSMEAVDAGEPKDHPDFLACLDPVEAGTIGVQAKSLALRPRQAFSQSPYFTSLRSIILVV